MFDRPLGIDPTEQSPTAPLDIEIAEAETSPDESGGLTVDFGGDEAQEDAEFSDNLADKLPQSIVTSLAIQLSADFDNDLLSRKDWEKAHTNGLEYLGIKAEERTTPWPKACGVYHPLLMETIIAFQSNAIMEIFPAGGPVKTVVLGKATEERLQQANRVREDMNFWLTTKMPDYRRETEKLLFGLGFSGCGFRKVYPDPVSGKPAAMFVPAEDMVLPYGASSLASAPRITHVMKRTKNDVKKLQVAGFYSGVDLPEPTIEPSKIKDKQDKLIGDSSSNLTADNHTLLEMHADVDLFGMLDETEKESLAGVLKHEDDTGVALPYVVTIDKQSNTTLSIRRNWREDDPRKTKRPWFVQYDYIPGFGAYGLGLIHIIGGITTSATSILRQLVDAGTLSNLPGGLKAKGMRSPMGDVPIAPGEWRDMDIPGSDISKCIMPLPYKEPSAVLFSLLQNLIDEGRRCASIADTKIGDMGAEAPVGTTLALLERAMKVMSAVQGRLHDSMKQEFALLAELIKDETPEVYEYDVEGGTRTIKKADYDSRVDILPVSDPNAASMAQRILQYQAALQLATQNPSLYDLPELHRQILTIIGLKETDRIIPRTDKIPPMDPVSENMAIINGKPVKAHAYQDHRSHIAVHMNAAQDPALKQMIGQSPNASGIMGAGMAHILEHLAAQYRKDIEEKLGIPLPPAGEFLPEDVEMDMSAALAAASEKLLQQSQSQQAQQVAQQQAQDPVLQMQQAELQIKHGEVQRKAQADQMRVQVERERIASQEHIAEEQIAGRPKPTNGGSR